jgi:predicted nucleic acid-binding protein
MPFVVDASVTASWLLPDESDPRAEQAYERLDSDSAVAPGLWWFELRNIFIVNERRGRLDQSATRRALELLASLPIRLDHAAGEATLLALARQHRLTVYDAAYLELAQREGLPLATLDEELARAARAEKVILIGSTAS